jgi:hypothetical protein
MSELNDFLKLMAEGKKKDPVAIRSQEIKENIKTDLGSLFSEISIIKSQDPKVQKTKEIKSQLKEKLEFDLNDVFAELSSLKKQKEELETVVEPIVEEVLIEVAPLPTPIGVVPPAAQLPDVASYLPPQKQEPDVTQRDIKTVKDKIKFLEQWISKIQNAGPGGGEVNLRYLDDVARETISDGRWLKYDGARKKFVFDDINPYEVVYNTTEVTTTTYTVQDTDYYIGVNYAGPVTITLPTSANSGRMLIIKDEDGDAETNPITVLGNVDNDAGGFIIQINNGAIQMIYRNGWRIV